MRAQPLLQTEVVSPEPSFPGSGVCARVSVCARAHALVVCGYVCARACELCVCGCVCTHTRLTRLPQSCLCRDPGLAGLSRLVGSGSAPSSV